MPTIVRIDPLIKFREKVHAGLESQPGPIQDALLLWAVRFFAHTLRLYRDNSRGGGKWPPLKVRTLMARAGMPVVRLNKLRRMGAISAAVYAKRLKSAQSKVRSTRKRIASGKAKNAILIDTGVLIGTLNPAMEVHGQHRRLVSMGIEVGYGGKAGHPKGKKTVAEIATFHQLGAGRLPKRPIIPHKIDDAKVLLGMRNDMEAAIRKVLKG